MRYFREIQASLNRKTARHPTRREPNIMDIESTTCGLEVLSMSIIFGSLRVGYLAVFPFKDA